MLTSAQCLVMGYMLVAGTAGTAHTTLEASTPRAGARVNSPPHMVVLDFTGPVRPRLSQVAVRGPGGGRYELGPPQVVSDEVRQPLRPLGAAGQYRVTYRVVAADGHPLNGSLRFTLARPGPDPGGAAAPAAPTAARRAAGATGQTERAEPSGPPVWVLTLGALGAVGAVTGAVWFGRRVTRDLG